MASKSGLILQHLLDCGVLEPNDAEEVLPIFSKEVASTVAVTIVTSFTEDGSIPSLSTKFSIDWTMQSVAYCLSLSTLFHRSLVSSMTIFRHWLTNPNFFKDDKTWNTYAQLIFIYLSQILQERPDDSGKISRIELILNLFDDFKNYQKKLSSRFDDKTWSVLIRILIGSADFLLKTEKSRDFSLESTNKSLLTKCFMLLFEIILNSKLTSKVIWSVFFKFCSDWSSNETFLKSWTTQILAIFNNLIKFLYFSQDKNNNNDIQKQMNLTAFHLHQFIYCINFTTITNNSKLFSIFSDLVQNLSNSLYDLSRKSSSDLYYPLPSSTVFFKLFGHWCFSAYPDSLLSYQSILVKVLMNIAGDWEVTPEWSRVLLSYLMAVLKKENAQLKQTIMRNGHHVLKQFVSDEIIEQFSAVLDTYSSSESTCMDFWFCYVTLLNEVAERKEISKKTVDDFLKKSKNMKSKMALLSIVLKQRPSDFVSVIQKITAEIAQSIKNSDSSTIISIDSSWDVNYNSIDFMVMICLLIASAPPFVKFEKIDVLLDTILDFMIGFSAPKNLINAFFVMLASVSRWHNEIFVSDFQKKLIQYLERLKKDENSENSNLISEISYLICGRPVDRTIQKVDVSKNLVSFMSGDHSIITVYGDGNEDENDNREDFVIHVRERRGFFIWHLKDEVDDSKYTSQKVEGELSEIIPINYEFINPDFESDYSEIEVTEAQVKDSNSRDDSYDKPSNHDQKSYISLYMNKHRLRHKAVDFLIQTQLSSNVMKIADEDAKTVLENFDKIDAVPVLRVPLFHVTSSGFSDTRNEGQSPLFKRFIALLGPLNESEKVPEAKLGLIDVRYSTNFENDGFVGIVFNECKLAFNYQHKSIPKCRLLFFVTPHDAAFYLIRCISNEPAFYCNLSEERMISTENLAAAIAMAIFQFTALVNNDFIFSKNKEREDFLKNIKKEKTSQLMIINGYNFDEFRK